MQQLIDNAAHNTWMSLTRDNHLYKYAPHHVLLNSEFFFKLGFKFGYLCKYNKKRMKTRIIIKQFENIDNPSKPVKRFCIEEKKHWWSRWRIRDWEDKKKRIPLYYTTYLEAINNI